MLEKYYCKNNVVIMVDGSRGAPAPPHPPRAPLERFALSVVIMAAKWVEVGHSGSVGSARSRGVPESPGGNSNRDNNDNDDGDR